MKRRSGPTNGVPRIPPSMPAETALNRRKRLLAQVPQVRKEDLLLETWRQDVEGVLSQYYGRDSLQFHQFCNIRYSLSSFSGNTPDSAFEQARLRGISEAEGFVHSRIREIQEDSVELPRDEITRTDEPDQQHPRKVFVVHGHDHGSKETVARYLLKLELEPVVLHELADKGRTIIEKFENHSAVGWAVVILSPDDFGYAKSKPRDLEERARQNVVFEMGYFVGRLGRGRTFVLLRGDVTRPSDIDGVLYIPMDDDSTWRMKLLAELKAAGLKVDANNAFR